MSTMLICNNFSRRLMKPDGTDWGPGEQAAWDDYAMYIKHGWANAWWLCGPDTTKAQMERLVRESKLLLGWLFYALQPDGQEIVIRAARDYPGKVILMPIGEFDSQVDWQAHPGFFCSREEAAGYYKDFFFNYKVIIPHRSLRATRYESLDGKTLEEVWQKDRPDWLRFGVHIDGVAGIHLLYEMGSDFLMLETCSVAINCQLAAAFLRGGAKQYRRQWALHISPWLGGATREGRGPTAYDEHGRHRAGNSAALLERHWVTSYLSGADLCWSECTDNSHWNYKAPVPFGKSNSLVKEKTGALSPAGEKATAFGDFCLRRHPERGTPYVPMAIMLEHCHGWNAGGRWLEPRQVWGGKIPYGLPEYMIEGIFDVFLPGYRLAGRAGLESWNPDVHWRSEHAYLEGLYAGNIDARRFEQGLFVPTPYGDCFDVITDRASPDALKQYSLLVLAGDIHVTGELRNRLADYAQQGGTVFLNFRHLKKLGESAEALDGLESFAGLRMISEYIPTHHPAKCHLCGQETDEGTGESILVDPVGAEVLVSGQGGDVLSAGMRQQPRHNTRDSRSAIADPLVTRFRLGKGWVVVSMPYYGLCHENHRLAPCVRHTLDHLVRPLLPVEITGGPIQYHVNKLDDGQWLIGLVNSSPEMWVGTISVNALSGKGVKILDIWSDSPAPGWEHESIPQFRAEVAPYSFRIFKTEHVPR